MLATVRRRRAQAGCGIVFCCASFFGWHVCPAQDLAPPLPDGLLYVVRRGWHIDIGLRAHDLQPPLAAVAAALPHADSVLFGFGDRHFLLAHRAGLRESWGALWPGPGLLLLTGLNTPPTGAFAAGQVRVLRLNAAQERSAQRFIARSLAPGVRDAYAEGPYAGSLFFLAQPRYSAVHTCNTWAWELLLAAGVPLQGPRPIFAGELWRELAALN
jgi:hypothetical protein